MSSTCTCTNKISFPFSLMKSVVSTFPLWNHFSIKNLLKHSYQGKYVNSPIISILNSPFISLKKSWQRFGLVELKIMSSTYTCTSKISFPFSLMKSAVSTFPLWNHFSIKNLLKLSYQALGACLRSYKAFYNLNTWFG